MIEKRLIKISLSIITTTNKHNFCDCEKNFALLFDKRTL